MAMFDNWTPPIVPDNCEEIPKLEPCRPNIPYEERNSEGVLIGYWWYYGDTITLDFNIKGVITSTGSKQYVDASQFFSDKRVVINLYDFRMKNLCEKSYTFNDLDTTTEKVNVKFEIDKELSAQLEPSTYFCTVKVLSDNLNYTIFGQQDATFFVR